MDAPQDTVLSPSPVAEVRSPAQALREDTRERLALFGQQILNAMLDMLFLALWAALTAGQKLLLDQFDAPQWIFWMSILFDVSTAAIVVSYVIVDVVASVRQMWAKGRG